ncbi:MAG: radical SAM protein [Chloroflexi bacterium]|nr:radical SAM protein [Chloroflexota bacterium]MBM3172208.1 radical SAM protein [Chloroflexota bacterium]MBM3174200.1 radical SAM protein [Chloroflexota bacterium]MBM4449893.1 radical SAM protein [Chloroflexota bacterium]
MISISRLLCDAIGPGDILRYGSQDKATSENKPPRPIVVWNCTRRCNLRCVHCYSSAGSHDPTDILSTDEAKAFIRDLADFGVPVLLFSGGEPLLRKDIFELADFARSLGIRTVLSTNGTLITKDEAQKIRDIGFAEAGISLDGIGRQNDLFRGKDGAYKAALQGIRNCVALGQRVSLRLTITRATYFQIPAILDLVEKENIDRVCFYHLAYVGRGSNLSQDDLSHAETREVIDLICNHTLNLYQRGQKKEILTVDNHADGVYLYLKLKEQDPARAERVLGLLRANGGNNSGIRIGAVDETGNVHPDQFWQHYSLGNVRQRKFGDIWMDTSDQTMKGLKDRKRLLKGRCARCQYLDLCNGNLRVRAEAVYGDIWAEDPACYLTDAEIGLSR